MLGRGNGSAGACGGTGWPFGLARRVRRSRGLAVPGAAAKSEEPTGGPESQEVRKSRLVVCWDGDLSRASSCFHPQLVQRRNPLAVRDADALPRPGQGKPPGHLKDVRCSLQASFVAKRSSNS